MNWIILVLSVLLSAGANVFMKVGMQSYEGSMGPKMITHMLKSPSVIGGIICFGLSFVAYSFILSKFKLSVAYPITTGAGFALIALLSGLFFGEYVGFTKIIGMLLVFAGVYFLSL